MMDGLGFTIVLHNWRSLSIILLLQSSLHWPSFGNFLFQGDELSHFMLSSVHSNFSLGHLIELKLKLVAKATQLRNLFRLEIIILLTSLPVQTSSGSCVSPISPVNPSSFLASFKFLLFYTRICSIGWTQKSLSFAKQHSRNLSFWNSLHVSEEGPGWVEYSRYFAP